MTTGSTLTTKQNGDARHEAAVQRRELNSVVAEATLGARLTRGQAPPEAPLPSALWKLPRGLVTSTPSLFIHAGFLYSGFSLPGGFCYCCLVNREPRR
mgnify:CR=1 FL=1